MKNKHKMKASLDRSIYCHYKTGGR